VTPNEEVIAEKMPGALQEVFLMQAAVVVGLISMITGNALQEDIVATARVLVHPTPLPGLVASSASVAVSNKAFSATTMECSHRIITMVRLRGPCAPSTRVRSMSPVRLGPVINVAKLG
jgi:hypothetical protein